MGPSRLFASCLHKITAIHSENIEKKKNMLEEVAKDYAAYFKLDLTSGFQPIQDVIDNMLTRLEELTSVLNMIKLKNGDCGNTVSDDVAKYRSEIIILSKKIATLNEVISILGYNMDILEKQVEKAESDFGMNDENKLKSFLKPFLFKNKSASPDAKPIMVPNKVSFGSVMDNFVSEKK